MDVKEARELINIEYVSNEGLDVCFRLSADVETERIEKFITALKCLEKHYQNKLSIEKELMYQIFSMHQTLQASMNHWKVSNPEGLDNDTCFKIFTAIRNVFTN